MVSIVGVTDCMFPCHASNAFPSEEHLPGSLMQNAQEMDLHDYNMFVGLHMCTAESYELSHMRLL